RGDSGPLLLYRGKPPKNEAEFFAAWGVVKRKERTFGFVETQSPVAVERVRLLEHTADWVWKTTDADKLLAEFDAREQLDAGKLKGDGHEYIAAMHKVSIASPYRKLGEPYTHRGNLSAYLLTDKQLIAVNEAPAFVHDYVCIRGRASVRNFI